MQIQPEKISETPFPAGLAPALSGSSVSGPYTVHETLLEQGSGPINEDALSATSRLSIVCDGATSLGSPGQGPAGARVGSGTSGGRLAAAITTEVFAQNPDRNLRASARTANALIREAMIRERLDMDQRELLWSTSFAAVQIDDHSINWCQIGDCAIVAVYTDGFGRLLTDVSNQDQDILRCWQRLGPRAGAAIHQELAADIKAVRKSMNRTFGSLNGEPEALDFLSFGCLEDDARITDILLFSDGLFPPTGDPELPLNIRQLVELYRRGGLEKVRNHIRRLQRTDPCCCIYPRFKKFDDISAIALRRND